MYVETNLEQATTSKMLIEMKNGQNIAISFLIGIAS
jgi:hypothetical protein